MKIIPSWKPGHTDPDSSGDVKIIFRCPSCKQLVRLRDEHTISKTGLVLPSFTCYHIECDFSDVLQIDPWPTPPKVNVDLF